MVALRNDIIGAPATLPTISPHIWGPTESDEAGVSSITTPGSSSSSIWFKSRSASNDHSCSITNKSAQQGAPTKSVGEGGTTTTTPFSSPSSKCGSRAGGFRRASTGYIEARGIKQSIIYILEDLEEHQLNIFKQEVLKKALYHIVEDIG